ncbi:hypothetical protein IWQ47_001117 [Aquimarina sp. EL_43]|uniref:hypothetical protein n=1 Tax=unclassified Aquimarina TaxID=2627091 RepID=UPI0018C9EBBB|nr:MULTISPECIES: hypothetical protein [unclassified Aquimarina]MBG6129580.1 hypothetical protein [Aquimarina sp. EL_35]MBG6150645.1 hypothetical protein [Aquimarina sp. EL_32]MBG6168047.1 hypothetical protein [Aquimarina sp. EL_43]
MKKLKFYSNLWKISVVLVVILGVLFAYIPSIQVENLINIQFSNSLIEFNELVKKPLYFENNTYYDFVFIIAYSFLFYYSLRVFEKTLSLTLSPWFFIICFIPGIFDSIENISGLYLVDLISNSTSKNTSNIFSVFYWFVRLKWVFVIFFILMTVTISLYYFVLIMERWIEILFFPKKAK